MARYIQIFLKDSRILFLEARSVAGIRRERHGVVCLIPLQILTRSVVQSV